MLDYIEIGATPCEEECEQVGSPDYARRAREECKRFAGVIRQKLGPEPDGARLAIKSFSHDFGSYYELVCCYDSETPEAVAYAFACESHSPVIWADIAPFDWRSEMAQALVETGCETPPAGSE